MGGDAREYYPFPQLMTPNAVAKMIAGGDVAWLVGEAPGGALVGSAAAMRNIGDTRDQIAEVFGVAVDPTHRWGGLGSALLRGLVDELADASEFILCEARTDDSGGWKVARNAGFLPLGYEPYAHSMPVGFESMVLTGRWRRPPNPNGMNGRAQWMEQARRLREAVTGLPSTTNVLLEPPKLTQRQGDSPARIHVNVRRDDAVGRRWFDDPVGMFDCSAGVIGLNPLQGADHRGQRFTHCYYVAFSASTDVGAARVVYDRVDARARVLGLRTAAPGVRAALLQHLLDDLLRLVADRRLVIIVVVDSNCSETQAELTNLGFFPTVYMPAFVAARHGRSDGVQYTRLSGCSLNESIDAVTAKDWPEAEKVITQVLRFAP